MITLYGIPNCDTIKKTRTWLEARQVGYTFHNYKTDGISPEKLHHWLAQQPLDKVMNKASTTWKALSDADKKAAENAEAAIKLMVENPSMIKRPVVADENGNVIAIGFKETVFAELFENGATL